VRPEGILEVSAPPMIVATAGGTGTVVLTSPAGAGGATVSLSASSGALSVPSSVVVPQGQTSATFPITVQVVSSAAQDVTITATLGSTSDSTVVRVVPAAMWLEVSPSVLTSNTVGTGRVNLATAATSGTVIRLRSNNSKVRVPASVTVPAGGTSATFQVRVSRVTRSESATITATGAGRNATITIQLAP